MIEIREEIKDDFKAIREINDNAFHQPQEGNIIDKLRDSGCGILSLVAVKDNEIAGHILFSPIELEDYPELSGGMGLAPMAVPQKYQGQGIGSMLVREGIKRLKEKSVPFIIVLGHKHYYPRFGFEPASKYGIKCQWEGVPKEAFMIMILDRDKMKNIKGVAKYRDEFNEAM
jgi:putative acetyltransferase